MKRFAVGLSVAVMAGMLVPQTAEACGRFKAFRKPQVNEKLRDVRKSEHLLAKGNFRKAARLAHKAFPRLAQLPSDDDTKALFDRAQRVAALAAVRSGGDVRLGRMRGADDHDRAVNVQWGHHVLMFHNARFSDNLVVRTQYAESLAGLPGLDGYAFDLLREMSNDDLMPTARGFALLASLQKLRGDQFGQETSLRRCREIGADEADCNIA